MNCISTTLFSVMVNGGPSTFFKASRGLRQDDPLSPLLFLTVMKAFSKLMDRARWLNVLKGVEVGSEDIRVRLSHLFFADDALIFCEPDLQPLLHLRFCFVLKWCPYLKLI